MNTGRHAQQPQPGEKPERAEDESLPRTGTGEGAETALARMLEEQSRRERRPREDDPEPSGEGASAGGE